MTANKIKKSYWGWGIAGLYTGFVVFMLAIVTYASLQHFDLVDRDYYAQEIRYEDQIQRMQRTQEAINSLRWSIGADGASILIVYPELEQDQKLSGAIRFFRPSNAALDLTIEVSEDDSNQQTIDISTLRPGKWLMQITWRIDQTEYYMQETLVLQ